jgi:hypothetical protein
VMLDKAAYCESCGGSSLTVTKPQLTVWVWLTPLLVVGFIAFSYWRLNWDVPFK